MPVGSISLSTKSYVSNVPSFHLQVWTKIRPRLEGRVIEKRNKRLAAELQPDVKKRMKILGDLYDDYLDRSFRPSERYYCPSVEVFRPLPDVMKLVEAEKGTVITAEDFEPIVENFGRHIAEYQEELKSSLEKTIPPGGRGQPHQNPLNLAKNVFQGDQGAYYANYNNTNYGKAEGNVLVGWSMVGTYRSAGIKRLQIRPGVYLDMPPGFAYNMGTSAISVQLIVLAGLDPETATVEDMDAADRRFVRMELATAVGYPVFTWRGAVRLNLIDRTFVS